MKTRFATFGALLFSVLAPIACSDGGTTGPGAPPPGPAPDVIQTVTVQITGLRITGTCDHDSIFESSGNGEFSFLFEVTPRGSQTTRVWSTGSRAYDERTHDTGGQSTTFNRNVTRGEDFNVRFEGTEFDGILGADSDFNRKFHGRSHRYEGGSWSGGGQQSLALTGDKSECGATLEYSISSRPAG